MMNIDKYTKPYHSDYTIIYSCQYHVIFCPKYRRKVLTEPIAHRMRQLLLEKQKEYKCTFIEMEILPEHVHLLIDTDPRIGINKIVSKIKGYTSYQLRKEFPWLKKQMPVLWTRSKFISTVGAVTLDVVQRYIEQQKIA